MLDDFRARLRRALGPVPADLVAAAGALADEALARPASPPVLSPWAAWMLVGLIRYVPHQLAIGDAIRAQLGKADGRGRVPGAPGWRFTVEQRSCYASSDNAGTIEFDLRDGSAEYVGPFHYLTYLDSLAPPEPPEARILALHPEHETLIVAFDELYQAGIARRAPDDYVYRLAKRARACEGDVRTFVARWEDPAARRWLAATLGDWPLAAELAPGDERIQRAAERTRADYTRHLESRLDARPIGPFALKALAHVAPAERLRRYLRAAIEGEADDLTRVAVDLMGKDKDADFGPEMMDLLARLPADPHGDVITAAGRYLLEHGHGPGVVMPRLLEVARVPDADHMHGNTQVGEIVLLALEHAPREALPLVRRGLRSLLGSQRQRTAHTLEMLGGAWAERELLAALRESTDDKVTAPYRVALRTAFGPEAHAEVERWEAAHLSPDRPSVWCAIVEGWNELNVDKLKERIPPLRAKLPADFGEA